ncbi:hypothetical protein CYY_003553 [Polysphondylium violaceum]|uniref:Uncharacterized protein n=1 Tax=Polysphondylium violaceum TaxID=133409 RepID=A0A8J4V120_9MYCE|nr:hypothetical protein CYY_003553 [Polysphondylium violaceum]
MNSISIQRNLLSRVQYGFIVNKTRFYSSRSRYDDLEDIRRARGNQQHQQPEDDLSKEIMNRINRQRKFVVDSLQKQTANNNNNSSNHGDMEDDDIYSSYKPEIQINGVDNPKAIKPEDIVVVRMQDY